ncbi:MAG: ribonuclease catalytic domain-containing protein [Termitinemataceae bacterium]|nr:MAG: ribonuclease catalytic domain-containing protein [Termitinemataceae bacterium]
MQNFKQKSLVVYKNKPAFVKDIGDKILIVLPDACEVKVREKDIAFLHEGPVADIKALCSIDDVTNGGNIELLYADLMSMKEVWELCIDEYGCEKTIALQELTELLFDDWTAVNAWKTYCIVNDGLYFYGLQSISDTGRLQASIKNKHDVEAETQKRNSKKMDGEEREAFLQRVRSKTINESTDAHFLQDVEALAFGQTSKSRTMRDIGLAQEPSAAHKLLLDLGYWDTKINPHPSRFGVDMRSPQNKIDPPPTDELRVDLSAMEAFAVDDAESSDPDDAVSLEYEDGKMVLYVHIADPAAVIHSGSKADEIAMERGATLYAPECISRMICDDALPLFALGLQDASAALTFKIVLNEEPIDGNSEQAGIKPQCTDIFLSTVHVTRLSYESADEDPRFAKFFDLMEKNIARRKAAGAVFIDFPEVKIFVKDGIPQLYPIKNCRSSNAIQECMLLAGEAAALWALSRNLVFPYICQQTGDMPGTPLPGIAGSYQLRRTMMPRTVSLVPAMHQGLGLSVYTQVTSPLRRYTDLLCHQQIRASLKGLPPLDADALASRLSISQRGSINVTKAERASTAFWMCVYLSGKINQMFEASVMDIRGPHAVLFINELGIETQTAIHKSNQQVELNKLVQIKLSSVKIHEGEISFVLV